MYCRVQRLLRNPWAFVQFSPREPRDISTETQCVALTSQAALNEAAPVPTWSEIEEQAREGAVDAGKSAVDGVGGMAKGATEMTKDPAKGAGDIGKSAVGGTVGVAKGAGKGAVKAGQNVVEGAADIVGGAADMTKGAVEGLVGGGN